MTGMFAGNDIYYPYASDGAVNIDGLLRRLEKTDIQVFVRWNLIRLLKSVWTSTEKRRLI